MFTKRIIPCLDVDCGRVVKGVNFVNIQDAGNPVELAKRYYVEGADELVFLDITASHERRDTMVTMVRAVAREVYIPFTVGGGMRTVEDIRAILRAGADKVSLNTAAVLNPMLITQGATAFGNQCIVLAIDAKRVGEQWHVTTHGGRTITGMDVSEWAQEGVRLGAGEILLTSMETDGTTNGFSCDITRAVADMVNVPVIASGGAGSMDDFLRVFDDGHADAALAASVFHFGILNIGDVKKYLKGHNVPVRI